MKKTLKTLLSALTLSIAASAFSIGNTQAAGLMSPVTDPDQTLEIRSHHVNVVIEDGYAITQVEQIFNNPGGQDLEAIYRFPVPDKAAVSEFTVWIDGIPVTGEVMEKETARQVYSEEKAAGRETGLTEKNKHYNFEMRVSPVRAGQETKLRLVYMQPVDIDTGIGRYVYPLEDGGTDEAATAFWTSDSVVQEDFSFNLNLRSGYKVTGARVPAHPQAGITQIDDHQWSVSMSNGASMGTAGNIESQAPQSSLEQPHQQALTLNGSESGDFGNPGIAASLDKDVAVYWRLASDVPGSVDLVTHKPAGSSKGTFLLTLSPGDDLGLITEGRDWVFVLDMSGSMEGKYATLVEGVHRALGNLQAGDRFRIVRFNNSADELTRRWVPVSEENVRTWSDKLSATSPSGGTNLYAGTEKGLNALDRDRTSSIILVTDGEANVGVTEKKHFLKLMERYDVRLFTAVMGNGANRPLLEAMTDVSNGFAVSVSNSDDIVGKLMEFTSKVTHQAYHDIEHKINGVRTAELTPEITSTLYRGEQLMVFGQYYDGGEAVVSLSGKVSGEDKLYETRFDFPAISDLNPELERLWAYAKTQDLQKMMDYLGDDGEYKSALVDIAVQHGLVTDHTSMVVMRDEQFAERGIKRSNRDRRAIETAAALNRSNQPVASNRVDSNQPAFTGSRAGHSSSGGGSMSFELLFLMPFVIAAWMWRRRKSA